MLNHAQYACVKPAHNLRKALGITSAHQSTGGCTSIMQPYQLWVQPRFIRTIVPDLSAHLSTPIICFSPLMNTFFTQFPQHLLLQPLKEN